MTNQNWHFETQTIHAGQEIDDFSKSRAVPIYQTSSYVFDNTQHAQDLFALAQPGNIYTRIMNPTQNVFEERVAALEGGIGTGYIVRPAAITLALLNIVNAGDEIVASSNLYGGSYNLLNVTFKKLGITVHFVDPDHPENFAAQINDNTKAIYAETMGNPKIDVLDITAVADVAHGIPLIIDNTFASPYYADLFEFGADIVIHSATNLLAVMVRLLVVLL